MSIVRAVAGAGSLAAAVGRLNPPPATASRKITKLEKHLRTKLFDRSARRLVLTDAGSSYVAGLKRILTDISEVERAASAQYTAPTGELVVTAPVGLGRIHLVPILAAFLSAHPDITLRFVLGDRILSLPEEDVDVALRLGVLPDSRLMALRLGSTSRGVCASPAYLALHGTPAAPEDVAGHDCILCERFQAPEVWTFALVQADMTIAIRPRLVVSNEEAACDAARAGIALTRAFSYHGASSSEAGTLTTVLDEYRPAPLPVSFVYPAGRVLPVTLRALLR